MKVVFHVDLQHDGGELGLGERCELKGVGPVPMRSALDALEDASTALVGTKNNKLVWFSEYDRRSAKPELPEFIKRAIRAEARDRCEADGCVDVADDIDHIVARCNDGDHEQSNLQALCRAHHNAKTRVDAPWTAGGIYGKAGERPTRKRKPPPPPPATATEELPLFDTG